MAVSIIIPIYNSEKRLDDCLKSVMNQTYRDFEVILIDDGSKDSSGKICKAYVAADARFKYFYQENMGVSSARNQGIKKAVFDMIVFIDSDDEIDSDYLERLCCGNQADFTLSGYKIISGNHQTIREYACRSFEGNIREFCKSSFYFIESPFLFGPCFKVFKKQIIIDNHVLFPEDISYGEDALFVIEYLKNVDSIKCIDDYLGYMYYQGTNDSLSSSYRADRFDIKMRINESITTLLSENNICDVEKIIAKRAVQDLIFCVKELVNSDDTYKKKRELFFQMVDTYSLQQRFSLLTSLSPVENILRIAVNLRAYIIIHLPLKMYSQLKYMNTSL